MLVSHDFVVLYKGGNVLLAVRHPQVEKLYRQVNMTIVTCSYSSVFLVVFQYIFTWCFQVCTISSQWQWLLHSSDHYWWYYYRHATDNWGHCKCKGKGKFSKFLDSYRWHNNESKFYMNLNFSITICSEPIFKRDSSCQTFFLFFSCLTLWNERGRVS